MSRDKLTVFVSCSCFFSFFAAQFFDSCCTVHKFHFLSSGRISKGDDKGRGQQRRLSVFAAALFLFPSLVRASCRVLESFARIWEVVRESAMRGCDRETPAERH